MHLESYFTRQLLYSADDHAVGLSTFTIMAGLGGSLGYAMGGLNWGWLGELNIAIMYLVLKGVSVHVCHAVQSLNRRA